MHIIRVLSNSTPNHLISVCSMFIFFIFSIGEQYGNFWCLLLIAGFWGGLFFLSACVF